jgi:hypothetical protein
MLPPGPICERLRTIRVERDLRAADFMRSVFGEAVCRDKLWLRNRVLVRCTHCREN